MNVNNFLLCVNEWIKWYQEKGWKNKKKQKKNPADLGEVTEKIELEEAVKSNKKRFFLYVRFSNTFIGH